MGSVSIPGNETRLRCKDGSYRWVLASVRSDRSAGEVYIVAKDIRSERWSLLFWIALLLGQTGLGLIVFRHDGGGRATRPGGAAGAARASVARPRERSARRRRPRGGACG